jgi:hypothetical protein
MPKEERASLIGELQTHRESRVILYCLGDRAPQTVLATQIALDIIPLLVKIFKSEGRSKKITLVIHSGGGNMDTPWPFVNLLREFSDTFEVIIPRRALSAATMICLGADRIVMTPYSLISPIDPMGSFNMGDGTVQQVAIEDIRSFIDFATLKIGLKDPLGRTEILKSLSTIGPRVLGSVNRTQSLIRKLASGLLSLHMDIKKGRARIEKIVLNLTEKSYSHTHFIGRREARDDIGLGNIIEYADEKTFDIIERLFEAVSRDLLLEEALDVPSEIEKNKPKPVVIESLRAIVQSESMNFEGVSTITILPNGQVSAPFRWETH